MSGAHSLHLQGQLDLVAHQDASRLQRLVPRQAEVPAIQNTGGAEARALSTPHATGALTGEIAEDMSATMIFNGVAVSGDLAYVTAHRITAIYTVPLK